MHTHYVYIILSTTIEIDMQNLDRHCLQRQTAMLVDLSTRVANAKQALKLSVLMLQVANQWLNAYKLGFCTWSAAKENVVMLDQLSAKIDAR